MSEGTQQDSITKKTVVYRMDGEEAVTVRRDVEYRATDDGTLTMDVYYPPDWTSDAPVPAVVIVAGYPDPGFERILGCKFKEMGSSVSWGRLAAASGVAAITYTNREPEADLHALVRHVRQSSASLGIDENRIGVWASSGNVPLALSLLMREESDYLKCAVLCYGCMLDLDGSTSMAEASKTFKFAYPCEGRSIDDLPKELPLFVARAGQDHFPHLNETLDRFVLAALACNLPITLANHATGPHAFDLLDDSETTREIIKQILAFMRFHLLARTGDSQMSIEQNKTLAAEFFIRLGAGDIAGALDTMTDDATWWISGKPELLSAAGVHSKEQMAGLLRNMVGRLKDGLKMTVKGAIAEGDKVALELESHGELENGRIYNNEYHTLLTIRDGKISEVREYLDTQHVVATWFQP